MDSDKEALSKEIYDFFGGDIHYRMCDDLAEKLSKSDTLIAFIPKEVADALKYSEKRFEMLGYLECAAECKKATKLIERK